MSGKHCTIYRPDFHNSQVSRAEKSLKGSYWLKLNFLSMSKPKISSNMINVKVSKGYLRISAKLSLDARTPKTLMSHISTQGNLI